MQISLRCERFPDELESLLFKEEGYPLRKGVSQLIQRLQGFEQTVKGDFRKLEEVYKRYREFCRDLGVEPQQIEKEQTTNGRIQGFVETIPHENNGEPSPDKILNQVTFQKMEKLRYTRDLLTDIRRIVGILQRITDECRDLIDKHRFSDIRVIISREQERLSFEVSFDVFENSSYVV